MLFPKLCILVIMDYSSLPKIELHLHLDCSLSYEVVRQIDPTISREDFKSSFIAPPKCTDLVDYLSRAIKGFQLMQTEEQLKLVTDDLYRQLHDDHVIYAEIRFAPLQHLLQGLNPEHVVETVLAASQKAKERYNIEGGVILCTLRHYSKPQSMETIPLCEKYLGHGVVGFDIAADEAGYPIDEHISAFEYARSKDIPCTAHAGEARGPDSVWETLKHFRPSRIGHGVRCAEDDALLQFLKDHDIHLEVCPTSNIQTNIFESIQNHNAALIFDRGISMSINTDARTISNTTLAHEYELMTKVFAWTKAHFKRCNLEAIRHAFTTDEIKEQLSKKINTAY